MKPLVLAALLLSLRLGGAQTAATADAPSELPPAFAGPVQFARDIKPIFESSCLNCHGHGREKGGFRLDNRQTTLQGGDSGPAIKPGHSAESRLINLVAGLDPDSFMPKKGKRLTPQQIGLLRAWIDQGMPWDPAVSFARRQPVNLQSHFPAIALKPDRNPVDQILELYFDKEKFRAPASVDDRRFARRVYLDVIGLLPGPEELNGFVADRRPDKRARLVRELLSRHADYAQHWLTFWNDLLRNDYRGTGYIDGGRKQITGWLYEALRTNKPYNRLVAELIDPKAECEGFVKGIVWRGVVNASQTPEMQAAQNISQVFMGVNLKCASCHDSFINDWQLADAYGMAAVYNDGPLEMFQCDKPTGKTVGAAFLYPELGKIDPDADKTARLKRLAQIITGQQDGRLSRTIVNRLWARFFGRGLVEPVDDMEQMAWNPDLLDWLAEDLTRHDYDLKRTIEVMLTSKAYQLPAVDLGESSTGGAQGSGHAQAGKSFTFCGPAVRRLTAEQFRDALGQVTGVWYESSHVQGITNHVRASLVEADPLATALGRPNREQVSTSRAATATTLQALELTNGQTLAHLLEQASEKLGSGTHDGADLASTIYQRALGRQPDATEAQVAGELLKQEGARQGAADLIWSVAMLPEFQLIY
jgi:mono/diheme cytochrome c family protein